MLGKRRRVEEGWESVWKGRVLFESGPLVSPDLHHEPSLDND